MSEIAVQIYEIQNPREADAVIALGVDRIGSVIVSKDNWKIQSVKDAARVSKETKTKHSIIPLFNDEEIVSQMVEFYEPDVVHFCESLVHGNGRAMGFERLVKLQINIKKRFPELEVMRSIPIATTNSHCKVSSLEIAQRFEKVSDCFLTDTWLGKEPVEGFVGITGQTCDWNTARKLAESSILPVIVAGGLSPENVYEAIIATRPQGVDSCTRTNQYNKKGNPIRFKKDLNKVKKFVKEVRRAENCIADSALEKGADSSVP